MKKYFTLLIYFLCLHSYGQYDSIKNQTIKIDFFSNKLIIQGDWDDYHNKKNERFVSHCPLFIDENNTILELAKWDSEKLPLVNGNDIKKSNKTFLKNAKKKNMEILISEVGINIEFYFYKLNRKSIYNPEKNIIIYHLLGVKNKYVYCIAMYNYDSEIDNPLEFLINLFNKN